MSFCPLDIVIAVDLSGSTHPPHHDCSTHTNPTQWPAPHGGQSYKGGAIYEAELKLLEGIIDFLRPGMDSGDVQVGVTFWSQHYRFNVVEDYGGNGINLTTDAYGVLNTSTTAVFGNQDPNYPQYTISNIANKMRQSSLSSAAGTNIPNAIARSLQVLDPSWSSIPGVGGTGPSIYNSDLGDRSPNGSNVPDFKSVLILITDADTPINTVGYTTPHAPSAGPAIYDFWPSTNPPLNPALFPLIEDYNISCLHQSSSLLPNPYNLSGHSWQYIFGCVARPGPFSGAGGQTTPIQNNIIETLNAITCNQNANFSFGNAPQGFYVDVTDSNAVSNVANEIANLACIVGNESFDCNNTGQPIPLTSGVIVQPWDCYDPGTGLGQYINAALCGANCNSPLDTYNCSGAPLWDCYVAPGSSGQYTGPNALTDCQAICKAPVPYIPSETGDIVSWNCTIDKYGIGQCNSVLGTGGTYATKALCLAVCEQMPILPTIDFPDTWKCHIPWHSTVGTCTKMTDGSGTYTTEQDCIDNCLHVRVTGGFEDTWGWNCDNSTQTCSGPVIGGTYPTQTDCQQYCVGTIGVGTLCDRIRSCPCGWTYNQTTQECESPGLTQTMIIDAIENCITFQNLPHQPVVGDIWANLSPSNISPLYAWSAAEVVEVGGQLQAISSIETRSQC